MLSRASTCIDRFQIPFFLLMSVAEAGFVSSPLFEQIASTLSSSPEKKDAAIKKVKSVFQFDVKSAAGNTQTWTLDLKTKGELIKGTGSVKSDVTISVTDENFAKLATGKLNGQKAFMSGKLKLKGNMMLATSNLI
jgi:3-hydroxyacyl-CoA dehydrogenase/3a,7a,12a-trihydroxy-5b-cholest-24-enoyl-CoA hydratase